MIRIQVEAHVGAITNLEAAKQAGYEVAIQSREARPGYPIHPAIVKYHRVLRETITPLPTLGVEG